MNTVTNMAPAAVTPIRQAKKAPAPTKAASPRKQPRPAVKVMPKLRAAEVRTIGQFIAAIAAAFLPMASYVIAHEETKVQPSLWVLVVAALMFSAPTLAEWAQQWCKSTSKAWGFTVLLEGVMVFSLNTYLGWAGLAILMAINCNSAWTLAGKSMQAKASRKD